MINQIVISDKIVLKKLLLRDINERYLSWFNDKSLKKKLVNYNYKNIDQLKNYYRECLKKPNLLFFGIFLKEKHIGNIKFENIYLRSSIASWGILIGEKKFRGKKIGYEVLSKSMEFLEKKYQIQNFIISASYSNVNARRLYYNLGFRKLRHKNRKIFLIKKCFCSKIILGTANFENNYGIRNKYVSRKNVRNILKFAKLNGINFIDSANSYGKSERSLGINNLENFNLISKLPNINKNLSIRDFIKKKLSATLRNTKKKSLYGYLVHSSHDLLSKKKKIIIKTLIDLKKQNKIKKIGVSVYEVKELKKILKFFKPDIVQLPINIFNQNFIKNNFLKKINSHKIEIHVRSIFLQGILLDDKTKFKRGILSEKFKIIDKVCKKEKVDRISFLLNFINGIKEIDKIVIGIDNINQLKKIVQIMRKPLFNYNYKKFALNDSNIIDPRLWLKN